MGVAQLRRVDARFIGGFQIAVTDVVHHRASEEVGVLQDDAQGPAQVGLANFVDVDAVVADFAVGDVVEAVDEVGDSGLARAGGADEGNLLAGVGVERHVVEHRLFRHIAKVHVPHGDVALELGVGDGAVGLMGMPPGPVAGALLALRNGAVGGDGSVDQGHIAVIFLGGLVHQLKDPLRAGQSHDDGVDLVADLGDGLVEGPGQGQEGDEAAQGDELAAADHSHDAAHNGENGVLDVAQVVVHRAHGVGVGAGLEGVGPEAFVETVEFLLAGVLVVENLHHPLAVDHFLHITVDTAQGLLLADEETGGPAHHELGHEDDARDGEQQHQGQDGRLHEHGDEHHNEGHRRGDALGDGLGDHLPQGIDVAGVAAHDIACGVGIEIPDGKGLHMDEHFIPDGLLGSLGHLDHEPLLEEGGEDTRQEEAGQPDEESDHGSEIRRLLGKHGGDVVVHQGAQGRGAAGHGHGGDDDAHHHHGHGELVFFHIAQQALEGFLGVFGFAAVAAHFHGGHYASPPFVWEA